MSKAENRALETHPKDIEEYVDVNGMKSVVDNNSWQRTIFLKGYHQAEEDNELTWEDMMLIHRCIKDAMNYHLYKMMEGVEGQKIVYQEVLKRFKDFKHVK